MSHVQWEYCFVDMYGGPPDALRRKYSDKDSTVGHLVREEDEQRSQWKNACSNYLNSLGKDGWEVVMPWPEGGGVLMLKRPKHSRTTVKRSEEAGVYVLEETP